MILFFRFLFPSVYIFFSVFMLLICCFPLHVSVHQVWFQNRRAKWRKAERSITGKSEHRQSRAGCSSSISSSPPHQQINPMLAPSRYKNNVSTIHDFVVTHSAGILFYSSLYVSLVLCLFFLFLFQSGSALIFWSLYNQAATACPCGPFFHFNL